MATHRGCGKLRTSWESYEYVGKLGAKSCARWPQGPGLKRGPTKGQQGDLFPDSFCECFSSKFEEYRKLIKFECFDMVFELLQTKEWRIIMELQYVKSHVWT